MSAMSDYLEAALINHIFRGTAFSQPAGIYIALTSGVPTDAQTGVTLTEISGAGYARASGCGPSSNGNSKWDAPTTAGDTENTAAIEFAAASADWGYVSGVAIVDALTNGNILFHGGLTTPRIVLDGDTFKFNAGDIDITLA